MLTAAIMIIVGFVVAFGGFVAMMVSFFKDDSHRNFIIGMIIMALGGFLSAGGFLLGGWQLIQQFFSILQ